MNIVYTNKFQFVKDYLVKNNLRNILDVGCRDCILKKYVSEVTDQYKGCDLFQNETNSVDYVLNFENGLPLEDNSFDCVVALDLVEHLNGFQEGVEELLRVTKKDLIIMLPNMSHLFFRLKFLFTGVVSGKYSLNINNSKKDDDRHRWLTVYSETNKFMEEYARLKKFKIIRYDYIGDGKKISMFAKFCKVLRLPKSLYVWSIIYILKKYDQ